MAIPKNKSDLTNAIKINYAKLLLEINQIPEELSRIKTLEGHSKNTFMSVQDLVSYLIGWGQLLIKWNEKIDNNKPVDFPETGYNWNELGLLAQKFYNDYANENYTSKINKLNTTVDEVLKLIDNKTNENLYERSWYKTYTLGRMIQLNTASPYSNATIRIRKWKKENMKSGILL